MKKVLAFDLGASSGRAIIATLDNGKIDLKEVHRFPNNGVSVRGTIYWDVLYLFDQIKQGIVNAKLAGGFDSIGIDTWGVDFGLIDKNGDLVSNPVHYRDSRTDNIPEEVFKEISRDELYKKTGTQIMNFNTLFQLYYLAKYRKDLLERADKFLFMPDLLNYFLTGEKKSEFTIASTSQMLNLKTRDWNKELVSELGIPTDIMCDLIETGKVVGKLSPEICEELGVEPVDIIATTSHDTASAVVSVPTTEDDFVYVSSGTWSLFGTELDDPLVSPEGDLASYTNEGGYGGKIRYLTNIMGLWLVQEVRRDLKKKGEDYGFGELADFALEAEGFKCFVNPDYSEFAKPGNMIKKIQKFCEQTGQYVPQTTGEIVRCIYESLALKYRQAYENLSAITGKTFKGINVVGGGSNATLFCQMTANSCNVAVSAGPDEATALGNVAVQFMASGDIKDVKEARSIIKNSFDVKTYLPEDTKAWDEAYERYLKIV